MLKQIERVRKAEQRTYSELVREALRTYFAMSRFPVETPTKPELATIKRGRIAVARGEFVNFDELLDDLATVPRTTRPTRARKTPRKRPKAY